eukprot:3784259-Amphidinium_carterae.1
MAQRLFRLDVLLMRSRMTLCLVALASCLSLLSLYRVPARQYETQVILKRLSELDDEEIRALCAEACLLI